MSDLTLEELEALQRCPKCLGLIHFGKIGVRRYAECVDHECGWYAWGPMPLKDGS